MERRYFDLKPDRSQFRSGAMVGGIAKSVIGSMQVDDTARRPREDWYR